MLELNAQASEPQTFPVNLRGYGVNPFGKPIWRVVFGPSRMHQIGGRWPDGSVEYRWVPRYPRRLGSPDGVWILEKWLSAQEWCGSKETYNLTGRDTDSGLLTLGEYPTQGEYEYSFTFPLDAPTTDSMIRSAIDLVNAGRGSTYGEIKRAILSDLQKSQNAAEDRAGEIWSNAQGPFRGNAVSGIPGKRTSEQIDLSRPSPLPVHGDAKLFTGGR